MGFLAELMLGLGSEERDGRPGKDPLEVETKLMKVTPKNLPSPFWFEYVLMSPFCVTRARIVQLLWYGLRLSMGNIV